MSLVGWMKQVVLPPDDIKQALRIRRFLIAVGVYAVCLLVIYLSCRMGLMLWEGFAGLLVIIPVINLACYLVLRSGLNKYVRDPSLTELQIYFGALVTMYGLYYSLGSRAIWLLFYVVVLLFGCFRMNTVGFLRASGFILTSYFIVILLLKDQHPQRIDPNIELVQLCMLACILLIISVIGGQISALRQKLHVNKAELARSLEHIREIAIRDDLTGLFNRRYLMERVEFEKNRANRDTRPFCLALVDIDHFKQVNDRHGHQTGDLVLRGVAGLLASSLRSTEFCGRYGGEEFVIVLTGTDMVGGLQAVERLRSAVAELRFGEPAQGLMITASFGLAEYRLGESVENTIGRADTALYRAKDAGRNRVETEAVG